MRRGGSGYGAGSRAVGSSSATSSSAQEPPGGAVLGVTGLVLYSNVKYPPGGAIKSFKDILTFWFFFGAVGEALAWPLTRTIHSPILYNHYAVSVLGSVENLNWWWAIKNYLFSLGIEYCWLVFMSVFPHPLQPPQPHRSNS